MNLWLRPCHASLIGGDRRNALPAWRSSPPSAAPRSASTGLVAKRCDAQDVTFDVFHDQPLDRDFDWQAKFESFTVCRRCHCSTVFVLAQTHHLDRGNPNYGRSPCGCAPSANDAFRVERYINISNMAGTAPPEHTPKDVGAAFREGATCLAVECQNAAACMARDWRLSS